MIERLNHIFITTVLILLFLTKGVFAQVEELKVREIMANWKTAVESQDIDAIVKFYSDDFSSRDGDGKDGVRMMWSEIKELGYLDKLVIYLENAQVVINNGQVEFLIFNEDGEQEMDFTLEKEDGINWLITGIPSENCNYDSYANPYGDDCALHNGYYRCWDIFVPNELKGKVPLVIDIHGWDESPSHQRSISGFESLAKEEGFIVAWPYGLCSSWNSGELCCPPASEDKIDDVGFIRKLIKEVSAKYNVDLNKVYVTGLSNGCAMTQRLANEASDIIAATACMSLHILVPKDPEYDPISVMTIMGTKDDLYNSDGDMPGAKENFNAWKTMNNCIGTYEVTWNSGNSVAWTYRDCENDTEVTLVTIDGGGHTLYKGTETEINTTQLAWDFLKRFHK